MNFFLQGGAIAIMATLRARPALAGCIALSTYIPGNIYSGKSLQGGIVTAKQNNS